MQLLRFRMLLSNTATLTPVSPQVALMGFEANRGPWLAKMEKTERIMAGCWNFAPVCWLW